MLIQGVVPLITIDSISSWVTSATVIAVGIFLSRFLFRFKDDFTKMQIDIVKQLTEINSKLNVLDGEVELLREYKHRIESIATTQLVHDDELKDHEARLRLLERPELRRMLNERVKEE